MALPHNPAGPQTPAGNTMSYPRGQSGGRTRNVVNIADPGGEGTQAYAFDDTTDAPEKATHGYANFRRQRYLHVQISGSISQGGDGVEMLLWGYNSFSGKWGAVQIKDPANDTKFVNVQLTSSHEEPRKYYKFDIDGMERVAIECTGKEVNGDTKVYVYLGVNSF